MIMSKQRKGEKRREINDADSRERNRNGKSFKPQKRVWVEADSDDMSDSEMLRIQGLIRCDNCENPYPDALDNCPTCGELHPVLRQKH